MASIDPLFDQKSLDVIEKMTAAFMKLNDSVEKTLKIAVNLDKTLGKQTGIRNKTEQTKTLTVAEKEAAKINQQFVAASKKKEALHNKTTQQIIRLRTETQKQTQAIKNNQKIVNSAKGSYDQLSATLSRDIKEWRALSAEQRKNSARGKELQASINKTQTALKKLDAQTGIHSRNVGNYKSALSGLSRVMGALGITAGLAGLVSFTKSLFKTANALQQVERRARVVFGTSFPEIEAAAESVAKKMGVTNSEFINMATNTGDLLIPLDFTRERAADLSIELQSLSGALDEWTGGTIGATEVSNILTKAMLGENEQLKRLGIAIRQDSEEFRNLVEQKQAAEGVTKAQARALATLELIQKKSTDAQTAYTQKGFSLLRFQKSAILSWKNMKEAIASAIVPQKTALELAKEQQTEVDALNNSLVPLIDEYEMLAVKGELSSDEQSRLSVLIQEIAKQTPAAITEISDYGEVLGISADKARELVDQQKAMLKVKNREAIEEQEEALKNLRLAQERATKQIESGVKVITKSVPGARGTFIDISKTVQLTDDDIAELNVRLIELGEAILGTEGIIKQLKGESLIDDDESGKVENVAGSMASLREELSKLKKQREQTNIQDREGIMLITKKIKELEKEILFQERLADGTLNRVQIEELAAGKMIDLAETVKDEVIKLEKEKQEGVRMEKRKTEQMSLTAFERHLAFEDEMLENSYRGRLKKLQEQYDEGIIGEKEYAERVKAIRMDMASVSLGFIGDAVDGGFQLYAAGLEKQMQALDKKQEYELRLAEGNEKEQEKINEKFAKKRAAIQRKQAVSAKLNAIFQIALNTARAVTAQLSIPGAGFGLAAAVAAIGAIQLAVAAAQPIPQFAKGGVMDKTGMAIVGEKGREIGVEPTGKAFITGNKAEKRKLKAGTRIIPNEQTEQILAGAGSDSFEIKGIVDAIREGDEKIIKAIRDKREVTIIPGKSKIVERKGNYYKEYLNSKVKF